MSDLAMAVIFGPAHRNSGSVRFADVVGHLYVGGSGVWVFQRLGSPRRAVEDLPRPADTTLRIRSQYGLAAELAAGLALTADLDGARDLAAELIGPDWADHDLEPSRKVLQRLGKPARGLDSVGCLITDVGGLTDGVLDELHATGWSLVVATSSSERRRTQWDQ
ncbi:hypothetical protein [Actinoplanes sp. NPDC049802]|uniref:hypothetical protein n=1 Tax=Actinoplanes sp. NPDC049802 TaxID=3154742 RepID=UPI0033E11E5B